MNTENLYVCVRECIINKPTVMKVEPGFMLRTDRGCPPHFRPWRPEDGEPQREKYTAE